MLPHRRLHALLFAPLFALAALAQPASETADNAERISLDEAIQRALAKNYAIKLGGFDTSIASARVTESLGKFDPVFTASYTYSESFNPALADASTGIRPAPSFSKSDVADFSFGGLLPWGMTYKLGANSTNSRGTFNHYADNYDTFAGISGTQPLLRNFGFSATLASIRIAQTNRSISHWQFRQTVIDTITSVIVAYHDVVLAYANLRSAVRSKELALQLPRRQRLRIRRYLRRGPRRRPRRKHPPRSKPRPQCRECPQTPHHRRQAPRPPRPAPRHRASAPLTHRHG
jgi:outer membrane protein TolC